MKLFNKILETTQSFKKSTLRFPATVFSLFAAFLATSFFIIFELESDFTGYLSISLFCGTVISMVAHILIEQFVKIRIELAKSLVFAGTLVAESIILWLFYVISEEIYAVSLGGIICICFLLLLYFMTSNGKNLAGGAHLLKSFAFATLVEAVIMIGGSLCVGAFVVLIYDFNDSYKLFLIWALLSSVLGILVFLSSLLKPDEQPEMPKKIYKSVLVYAQLSTYFALTAVLYLYLLKMVFMTELPSGGVNPYVTAASVAFLFNLFAVGCFGDTSKPVRFFMKYGGVLMMPLILMQSYALGIRLYYYGLTTLRMVSVCSIIITFVFALGTIIKKIGIGKPLLFSALLVLAVTLTPANIINIPLWQQSHTLETLLVQNDMIAEDGSIIQKPDLDNETKEKIAGAHKYIRQNAIKAPDFLEGTKWRDTFELFGFDEYSVIEEKGKNNERYFWFYSNIYGAEKINISEYSDIAFVDAYIGEDKFFSVGDEDVTFHIGDILSDLVEEYGMNEYNSDELPVEIIVLDESTDMILERIEFLYDYNTEETKDIYIKAMILFN